MHLMTVNMSLFLVMLAYLRHTSFWCDVTAVTSICQLRFVVIYCKTTNTHTHTHAHQRQLVKTRTVKCGRRFEGEALHTALYFANESRNATAVCSTRLPPLPTSPQPPLSSPGGQVESPEGGGGVVSSYLAWC